MNIHVAQEFFNTIIAMQIFFSDKNLEKYNLRQNVNKLA